MRLRAGMGLVLLALGACAHIPERIFVDIDGSTIEIKKKEPLAPESDEEGH